MHDDNAILLRAILEAVNGHKVPTADDLVYLSDRDKKMYISGYTDARQNILIMLSRIAEIAR